MKVYFLIVIIFIALSVQAFEVKVRDSQTGRPIAANLTITSINTHNISKNLWHKIRMGHHYNVSNIALKTKQIQSQNNIYSIPDKTNLQILTITAENYYNNQTYIEPNQKIVLTDIFLDRDSDTISPCDNFQICGYIYDKISGNPIFNSSIELTNTEHRFLIHSNQQGFFKFNQFIPDNATLVVSHMGYRTQIWNAITLKSSFSMIIDLEQGSGIIEHSMRHPLMDVRDKTVNNKWLQAKLSQRKTENLPGLLEHPGGGYYIEPPRFIL